MFKKDITMNVYKMFDKKDSRAVITIKAPTLESALEKARNDYGISPSVSFVGSEIIIKF